MTRPRSPARNSPRRGEYVSDRLVRFPGSSWQEIEALPQPLRWTVQRTIFHLLDEPVPTLADPFPSESEEGRGRRIVPAALSNPRPADYEKYGLHHRRTHRDPRRWHRRGGSGTSEGQICRANRSAGQQITVTGAGDPADIRTCGPGQAGTTG
jgi:hypothetical protein